MLEKKYKFFEDAKINREFPIWGKIANDDDLRKAWEELIELYNVICCGECSATIRLKKEIRAYNANTWCVFPRKEDAGI